MDFHSGPCSFRQRVRKILSDIARPVDVRFESDGVRRGTNRLEHGWENLIAIVQGCDPVSGQKCWAEKLPHGTQKLGISHSEAMLDQVTNLFFACAKI